MSTLTVPRLRLNRGRARFRMASLVVAVVLALGLSAGVTSPAQASAYGCGTWGGIDFTRAGIPIHIPSGTICHRIVGDGHDIAYQTASFASAGSVCNWHIDWVYINTSNQVWYRDNGPMHNTCDRTGGRTRGTGWAQYGLACAYIYAQGVYVARQCHNIVA